MNYKILGIEWRAGTTGIVGIVAIESGFTGAKGWKAYIGVGRTSDEEKDAQDIAGYGIKLKKEEAVAFFPGLDENLYIENSTDYERIHDLNKQKEGEPRT